MSPLEAMARAHYEWRTEFCKFANLSPAHRQHEINSMRAALTALRDNGVTKGMIAASVKAASMYGPREQEEIADEFRAMLDAALNVGNGE